MLDKFIALFTLFRGTIYRRLLTYLLPHKYRFFLGLAGGAAYSGIDAYFTHLMKPVMDQGFIHRDHYFISLLPFLVIGIFILRGAANFIGNYFMSSVGRHIVCELRNKMIIKLTRLPSEFYDNSTSGQLLSKIIYNVDQVANASTNAIITTVQSIALILGLLVVMFINNWRLTLFYLVALPIMAWAIRLSSQYMRRASLRAQETLGEVSHISEELIEGYKEIRIFGGEKHEIEKFDHLNQENRHQGMSVVAARGLSTAFVQLLGACLLASAMWLATTNALVISSITPGAFVAILFAMLMLLKPLKDLTNVNNIIQQGIAGAQSVFELLDSPEEKDEGKILLSQVKGKITFEAVQFSYRNSGRETLQQLSLVVQPGENIALVGRSGSGKSTLINLIPRFYELQSGRILIDDIDIHDMPLTHLRSHLSIVSQRVVLFNDTIAHNIAYGCLAQATEKKIWEALDRAHAREFIEKLPNGLNTLVGENGLLLSGGQRQRLAIARAILKNAPILILDEATSSLDSYAERAIQAALEDLMKDRTTLIIAHRLSTIENTDRIVVMDQGRIVEVGSHEALLNQSTHYLELYRSQFRDEKII